MIKLLKFQAIAFAIGLSIALAFDFLTIHPESLTERERNALGYYELKDIYLGDWS